VNFDWGSGSPDASIGADTFSARWMGQVQAQFTETYTFYTVSDDGVRLWVNGQLVVDSWVDQGPTEHSGTIALSAGQKYDLKMEYYENGGGATAKLLWSSASTPKQVIPQNQLYPVATATYTITASVGAGGTITPSGGGHGEQRRFASVRRCGEHRLHDRRREAWTARLSVRSQATPSATSRPITPSPRRSQS